MNFLELFNQKSLIAAHRGANSIAPENTLLAMKKSVGHCDFIEIDVQLSSDGVAVVMHDNTLERTTNVNKLDIFKGRYPYRVSDFTCDELTLLDYGDGGSLLTLEAALTFIKENESYLNVEIKDMQNSFSDTQVVSTVLSDIKNLALEKQVLISSFRGEYLALVKKISPEIATAFLADTNRDNLIEYLKYLDVNAYHISEKLVDKDLMDKLKAQGFFIGVYVVSDKAEQKKLFDMGVTTVFSDMCSTLNI